VSPYKQIIVVNSVTKFTDMQHSVCAHTLCSNHRHVQIQWQFRILGFSCKNNPSKCTVISSHGQVVTQSTRHNAVVHDGQLVTRF